MTALKSPVSFRGSPKQSPLPSAPAPSDGGYLAVAGADDSTAIEQIGLRVYAVLADYTAVEPDEMDLAKGERVVVHQHEDDGWWLASSENADGHRFGNVPSTYLMLVDEPVPEDAAYCSDVPTHRSLADYTADDKDELTIVEGSQVITPPLFSLFISFVVFPRVRFLRISHLSPETTGQYLSSTVHLVVFGLRLV